MNILGIPATLESILGIASAFWLTLELCLLTQLYWYAFKKSRSSIMLSVAIFKTAVTLLSFYIFILIYTRYLNYEVYSFIRGLVFIPLGAMIYATRKLNKESLDKPKKV